MTEAWLPPTEQAQHMLEAKNRGDTDAYLRWLAGSPLYMAMSKQEADDRLAGSSRVNSVTFREHEQEFMQAFSLGGLPQVEDEYIFYSASLNWILETWSKLDWRIAFHAKMATEMRFSATELAAWAEKNPESIFRPEDNGNELIMLRGGPLHGRLAHALACGIHLAVRNAAIWNSLGTIYTGYLDDMRLLRQWWGIATAEDWQPEMDALLEGRNSDPAASLVLDLRRQLVSQHQISVDSHIWGEVVTSWCQQNGIEDATVQTLLGLVERISRYEERFRGDGLLPPGDFIKSIRGYDYGRAVNMARWGLAARFCDHATAEKLVLRAGELCHSEYDSWVDFSAGYILGRALRFDDGEFGEWYQGEHMRHVMLTDRRDSPWRNIAF